MTQHEYAIIGHNRSAIGRWLGFAALLLAPGVTFLVGTVGKLPFVSTSLQAKLLAFTVSAGVVYGGLYWFFNNFVWRWIDKLLKTPNLSGEWKVNGSSLELDGSLRFPAWSGTLCISQKWDRIAIELKTDQSLSFSETASVLLKHNGEAKLSYSYQNHPKVGEGELQKHQGFCELTFEPSMQAATGHYFNSLGRYTFGSMVLTKVSP